jgi:hypothetical protein
VARFIAICNCCGSPYDDCLCSHARCEECRKCPRHHAGWCETGAWVRSGAGRSLNFARWQEYQQAKGKDVRVLFAMGLLP